MDHHSVCALTLLGFRTDLPTLELPVAWSDGWQLRFDDWGRTYMAFASQPGNCLTLKGLVGRASLSVVATAWSGRLEVSAPGQRSVVDLYSAQHELQSIELPGSGKRDVEVCLQSHFNAQSKDRQVWLRSLELEIRPPWVPRHRRLNDAVTWVDADQGQFLVMERDNVISHCIKHGGAWGPQQVVQFRQLVEAGTTVIDIGANLGHHTVVLSKLVGAQGCVLAFEPQPKVHRMLQANLAINQCDNVVPYELALGDQTTEARMFPPDDREAWNVGSLQVTTRASTATAGGLAVKLVRLDDIVGGKDIDFVKSDAQGFDFAAFRGAAALLSACKPMILTEIAPQLTAETGEDYRDFYAFLIGLGYQLADPETLDFSAPPRLWSGRIDEEWELLAVHPSRPDHVARIKAAKIQKGI